MAFLFIYFLSITLIYASVYIFTSLAVEIIASYYKPAIETKLGLKVFISIIIMLLLIVYRFIVFIFEHKYIYGVATGISLSILLHLKINRKVPSANKFSFKKIGFSFILILITIGCCLLPIYLIQMLFNYLYHY